MVFSQQLKITHLPVFDNKHDNLNSIFWGQRDSRMFKIDKTLADGYWNGDKKILWIFIIRLNKIKTYLNVHLL